jgi:hypothetical protein
MQTGIISFCGQNSLNIKSNDTKKILNDRLLKYDIKVLKKHFEKFDSKSSISKLKTNPYVVSLKSNGNPYLLFLTKFNDNDVALFIDKKIQQGYFLPRMIIERLCWDHQLFSDTIFDGEMIKNGDNWLYLLNDVYVHKGKRLETQNCMKRLQLLDELLLKHYFPLPNQKFNIQIKKYFKVSDVEDAISLQSDLPYTSRGLIFKPLFIRFRDILFNFDDSLIDNSKRKKYSEANRFIEDIQLSDDCDIDRKTDVIENTGAVSEQSLDDPVAVSTENLPDRHAADVAADEQLFKVETTEKPDVYRLYTTDNRPAGFACVRTLKTSKLLRSAFKDTNLTDKLTFRCKYTSDFTNKWMPVELV